MNALEERLNSRLEQATWGTGPNGQRLGGFTLSAGAYEHDPDVDELVVLAQRLQQAPQLQVTPDFARQLERRVLRRHAERQIQRGRRRSAFFSLLRAHPALGVVLGACLLFCLVSTSILALAAQVTDPTNPLSAITRWEHHSNPADQATLDLQFARDQLKALPSLADAAHAGAYRQALTALNQQVNAAASAINGLPAGAQQTHLAGELANLKGGAIHALRDLLAQLALPERLATTDELARLGDTVPSLRQVTLTLPEHPNEQATISFTGLDLQSGARLLVDGKVLAEAGTIQNGQMIFVVEWNGDQHPHNLGILNPDGTAAQTTAISIKGSDANRLMVRSRRNRERPLSKGQGPPLCSTCLSHHPL